MANDFKTIEYLTKEFAKLTKEYGQTIGINKTKLISIIKEKKYKNKKLKIEIHNGTINEIEEGEPFTYLGMEFIIKNGKIIINEHIEKIKSK